MLSAAATVDQAMSLYFAQSASKAVGTHGPLIEKMRDNAPRIVGTMKIGMDASVAMTGSPWLISYSVFAIIGRLIAIAYGSKNHQDKLAKEKAEGKHQKILGHSVPENAQKILHPREYPVEASASFSVIAEIFGVAFGISKFVAGGTGYTALITGLIAVWSYGNIVFHKEKKKNEAEAEKSESLVFAQSQSKLTGFTGRIRRIMKDNPILVSSMVNVSICAAMFCGGLIEGYGAAYLTAAVVGGIANLTQGLLVRKHDYNVEGVEAEKAKQPAPSFQERLAQSREDGLGLQPV